MLGAPPPKDCIEDARRVLAAKSLACKRVISVDHDSILFIDMLKRPRTLWLHRSPAGLRVHMDHGFVVDAPEGWHD